MLDYAVLLPFQFHKGTIRTIQAGIQQISGQVFQFHKGTIRTLKGYDSRGYSLLFQFHKGTIRTLPSTA